MSRTFQIVNGDVVISSQSGQPIEIVDRPKLSQDLQELFTIEQKADGFGAGIEELVGFVAQNDITFRVAVFEALTNAIERMKNLQQRFNADARPTSELIAKIGYLNVQVFQNDGTAFSIRVDVTTVDGNTVTVAGQSQVIGVAHFNFRQKSITKN